MLHHFEAGHAVELAIRQRQGIDARLGGGHADMSQRSGAAIHAMQRLDVGTQSSHSLQEHAIAAADVEEALYLRIDVRDDEIEALPVGLIEQLAAPELRVFVIRRFDGSHAGLTQRRLSPRAVVHESRASPSESDSTGKSPSD